jgi:hypothetical protein
MKAVKMAIDVRMLARLPDRTAQTTDYRVATNLLNDRRADRSLRLAAAVKARCARDHLRIRSYDDQDNICRGNTEPSLALTKCRAHAHGLDDDARPMSPTRSKSARAEPGADQSFGRVAAELSARPCSRPFRSRRHCGAAAHTRSSHGRRTVAVRNSIDRLRRRRICARAACRHAARSRAAPSP